MRIGWIGAGKMGLPICQRLKAMGHDIVVFARTETSAENLTAHGLLVARNLADLCNTAEIVFSSISDDTALLDILDGVVTLKKGSTYIDISTVSPQASAQVAARLLAKDISYLRSPVSGSTIMAQAGTLTAIVSGPKTVFDQHAALFEVFAKKAFHVGAGEEARYLKLVLNGMVAATSALLGEALAFGKKGGLSNATMLDVISQSVVASPLINYKRDMILSGNYKAAASLAMLKKDMDLLLKTSAIPLPLSTHIHEIYHSAINQGLGEEDFFVLVRQAQSEGDKL